MSWRLGLGLLLLTAAACGGPKSTGPAWPRSAGRAESAPSRDGGESLEPQQAAHVAAVEHADDPTPSADDADIIVVEAPALPVEIPPLPATGDAKPPAGEIQVEVIEIRPDDIQIEP
jgi:hypothetical protein